MPDSFDRRSLLRLGLHVPAASLVVHRLAAQALNNEAISADSELEKWRAAGNIPGIAAIVLKHGRVVMRGVAGVRRAGDNRPVTFDDSFHLGSCTKAMTGTLTAIVIDEGRLQWSTTLGDLFGNAVKMLPVWKAVTVRQLLNHRAGFPHDPALVFKPGSVAGLSVQQQRAALVAAELARQPEVAPGSEERYSNVDYVVIGAALEKITGISFEALMRERLFKPLGILTGGFGAPGTPGKVDAPWGHDERGRPVDPGRFDADSPPYFGPSGRVHMTMADWAKFTLMHLRGDSANPNRQVQLLQPQTFDELHRSRPGEGYSAGWFIQTVDFARGPRSGDAGLVFGHEGSNGLWYSKVLAAPELDLAVLVACNRGGDAIGGKAVPGATLAIFRSFA